MLIYYTCWYMLKQSASWYMLKVYAQAECEHQKDATRERLCDG
jgi:hypothetical protein